MPLDTLTAARDLEAAGAPKPLAEAIAHVAIQGADDGRLRTIEREVGELRGDVKLLQWIAGFNVALTAAVLGRLLFLP